MQGPVAAAFAVDGPLAQAQPGYAERGGQTELALAVADAIENATTLVAEAGTGTGKTFAYLVPVLLSGGKVLISTGTKTLQDQLFSRDLPRVKQALGLAASTALLKGRANYVCRHHLRRNLEDGRFERREDIAVLKRIERFAAISSSGDRAQAPGIPEESPVWAKATSTRENCLGQDCPELAGCFVFKARQAAQQADVVVVNHHLFCADLALREEGVSELLPAANAVVFDEAHQLPEIATQFFGRSVSTRQLADFARDLLRIGLADARDAADWMALTQGFEQSVRVLRLAAGRPGRIDAARLRTMHEFRLAVEGVAAALPRAELDGAASRSRDLLRLALRARELAGRLRRWLQGLDAAISGDGASGAGAGPVRDSGAEPAPAMAGDDGGLDAAAGFADALATADTQASPDEPAILWVEVHQGGVTLHATPLSVAATFRRHRESAPRAWIFTSATLAVAGRCDHFTEAMGLDDAQVLRWESPFDYQQRALLYVPRGIGDPASAEFGRRVGEAAWPLIAANRGRAFVLCTSLRMVDTLAALLGERIKQAADGIELLVQGQASRSVLIERFRNAAHPLLIGSASFWEGVDVVGAQLSLVVIDKLPFASPDDPVLRARVEALRRAGGEPFRQIQLPAAAMSLKQGAGRLIRSETDRGVLVICDERLLSKSYGKSLLQSLPPFTVSRDAQQALAWLSDEAAPVDDAQVGSAQPDGTPALTQRI
ncbi:MAG: ATP-dependent DNA helicase [Burkholderiales bacterium]|nr:ATP-dependent DNA helicase [Burkholderiales bacterium]